MIPVAAGKIIANTVLKSQGRGMMWPFEGQRSASGTGDGKVLFMKLQHNRQKHGEKKKSIMRSQPTKARGKKQEKATTENKPFRRPIEFVAPSRKLIEMSDEQTAAPATPRDCIKNKSSTTEKNKMRYKGDAKSKRVRVKSMRVFEKEKICHLHKTDTNRCKLD